MWTSENKTSTVEFSVQKEYEERTKAAKKTKMDAKKNTLRSEDIQKGTFVLVSNPTKNEPVKADRTA